MHVYDSPIFNMACQQFDAVADRLQISDDERDRLKYPKRSMIVARAGLIATMAARRSSPAIACSIISRSARPKAVYAITRT